MARTSGWWVRFICIPLGGLLVYAAWIGVQFLTVDPRNTTFLDLFLDPHSGLYTVWALYLWLAGSVFVAPLWALGRRVGLWVIPTVMIVAALFCLVAFVSDMVCFERGGFFSPTRDAQPHHIRDCAPIIGVAIAAISAPAWVHLGLVALGTECIVAKPPIPRTLRVMCDAVLNCGQLDAGRGRQEGINGIRRDAIHQPVPGSWLLPPLLDTRPHRVVRPGASLSHQSGFRCLHQRGAPRGTAVGRVYEGRNVVWEAINSASALAAQALVTAGMEPSGGRGPSAGRVVSGRLKPLEVRV